MAFLRDLEVKCGKCGGRAAVELFTVRGLSMGKYCRLDGRAELARVERLERQRIVDDVKKDNPGKQVTLERIKP